MATENTEATSINFQSPFSGNQEWLKSFPNVLPVKVCLATWHEALGFAALCLQDQADYIKSVAECANPADALKCNAEFARKSWARSFGDGSKILDPMRAHVSAVMKPK